MTSTVLHADDGRRIGLSGAGDPAAQRLVVLCHPSPGSSGFDPDPTLTDRAGIHLIALDRPGYGGSEPLPAGAHHRVADRAAEIGRLVVNDERTADRISAADLHRFALIGWGTGSLVAAAVAGRWPDRVDRLALIGPPSARTAAKLARRAFIAPMDRTALHVDDADPELTRHVGLLQRVDRMVDAAFVQGRAGVDADRMLMADPHWHDDLGAVTARTELWMGADDQQVDAGDARWWKDRIPQAEPHLVPGAAALTIATVWARVLDFVAPDHGREAPALRQGGPARIAQVDPVHPEHG